MEAPIAFSGFQHHLIVMFLPTLLAETYWLAISKHDIYDTMYPNVPNVTPKNTFLIQRPYMDRCGCDTN